MLFAPIPAPELSIHETTSAPMRARVHLQCPPPADRRRLLPQMEPNPICLNINWRTDEGQLQRWKDGQTGYPFIDAAMRQLIQVRGRPLYSLPS